MDQDKDVVSAQPASGTSRKDFLKKSGTIAAGAAALAAAGAPALVEAAGVEKPRVLRELAQTTVTISRGSVTGSIDTMGDLIKKFQKQNPSIKVKQLFAPQSSTATYRSMCTRPVWRSTVTQHTCVACAQPPSPPS